MLLGIVTYILILPVLEELATVVVQALEIVKGKAMLKSQEIQNKLLELAAEAPTEETPTNTSVIGFQVPEEIEILFVDALPFNKIIIKFADPDESLINDDTLIVRNTIAIKNNPNEPKKLFWKILEFERKDK